MSSECGFKEVYIFPHNYYLSLLLLYISALFCSSSILLVHKKKCFSFF